MQSENRDLEVTKAKIQRIVIAGDERYFPLRMTKLHQSN